MNFSIQTKQVKDFFAYARAISKGMLPIHDFVKLDGGRLVKDNTKEFVSYEVDADGSVLLDESILMAVASQAGDTIEIKVTDKYVQIGSVKHGLQPVNFYSNVVIEKGDAHILNGDVLEALFIASNFCNQSKFENQWSFIFITEHSVSSRRNEGCYCHKFDDSLPEVSLSPKAISAIQGLSSVSYWKSGTLNLFSHDRVTFGFRDSEYKPIDVSSVRDRMDLLSYIEVDTKPILDYCDLTMASNRDNDQITSVQVSDALHLSYSDTGFAVENEAHVTCDVVGDVPSLNVNTRHLKESIVRLPGRIRMSVENGGLIFWDESNVWFGVLMGMTNG